ncbi:MAG: bifunctional [glutamine synthetase] adenylyltransferase/[glutamine synthetase]-adenylyl-L-tyrosine phosphorylase [Rhodospirillales bacterium]|nr:bifunctional [glutamine synthetase] adenylyltransferase/[glutamine synthetase]-adenylyl-L-tyrosine phosphorylase [Rhodospirillales bacterium]
MGLTVLLDQLGPALPPPGDPAQAELGLEHWRDAAAELAADEREWAHALAADPAGRRLLETIFGNSPFLARCCLVEPGFLVRLVRDGPDATFAELEKALNSEDEAQERAELMRRLRIAKRRAALTIALADIGGIWPLERVTGALSRFAEGTIEAALRHLLPDPTGFIVLAMGKLGAFELNYSSDVDLMLLFERERVRVEHKDGPQPFFTRLARDLVTILAERTRDGYVFRTDLRLRPDPASTPPAVSVEAALSYYETTGQNWERAALIKARPVAGDRRAGAAFLAELTPFLWRKHLDFAAIQDIHSIKRQINAHRGGAKIAIEGHDVKLGRGGIREIEFFAQTQQLIWGGRIPELRVPGTEAALAALAAHGKIDASVAADLSRCYRFLRRVEHRLQMVDDAQTHRIPADANGLARIAAFLGYEDVEAFRADFRDHLQRVERHYADLFEEAPSLAGPGNLVFTGIENDPGTLATLREMGYAEPDTVASAIRGWHHGRYRATRSQRAREILTELVPGLLGAFAQSPNPDAAFLRFDQFLSRLPAGVQVFSLLYQNPPLLAFLAEVMGAAPRLADLIARHPGLLDAVLSADFFEAFPTREALEDELRRALARARDHQDELDIARRWANERKFQIGVQLLRGTIDAVPAGAAFADIAEASIATLLDLVEKELARTHGRIPGGAAVVLGMGKLGGREMTPTSDLDLILIYEAPEGVEGSDGPRPLAVSTWYARLCQRLVTALTALTPEGRLYEVDMRLRPSGNAGPAASSFDSFRRYHAESAWTWEHMALTRARPVAGDASLAARVMEEIRRVLARPRDKERLVLDVAEMREKMAAAHPDVPEWEVKHRRGGLVDIEFIAQYLQLREGVFRQNTAEALAALPLADGDRQALIDALRLWQRVQCLLKLLVERDFDENAASPALKAALARGAGAVDFATLKTDMTEAAARAKALYDAIVAEPAAQARTRKKEETGG